LVGWAEEEEEEEEDWDILGSILDGGDSIVVYKGRERERERERERVYSIFKW